MEGVILFADNNVFSDGKENDLFKKFITERDFSVLPIDSLECLEATIKSASTFKACIIDWNFKNEENDEDFVGVQHSQRNPLSILLNNTIYSLVYIYSEIEISENDKNLLKNKYGNKICFKIKGNDTDREYKSILRNINKFEEKNDHMNIAFVWSQVINGATQNLFRELELADPNWIREFRDSVEDDGGDPVIELIDIFNNVLCESIVQNQFLKTKLAEYEPLNHKKTDSNTAKLYQRLLYSKLTEDSPIMTGDIFKFNKNTYGILITPECEIKNNVDNRLEFLVVERDYFQAFLSKHYSYNRDVKYDELKDKTKKGLRKVFNNENLSTQILPVFPFATNRYNETACINFKSALRVLKKREFENKRIGYKLNSPYIHQLRQRFIAFYGKYGVPAIPNSLRDFNLKG